MLFDVGESFVVIAGEDGGCDVPANVTVDAGEIDVEGSWCVERVDVVSVCHGGGVRIVEMRYCVKWIDVID